MNSTRFCLYLFVAAYCQAITNCSESAELLIKWRHGPESVEATAVHAQFGTRVLQNFKALGWQLIKIPSGIDTQRAIRFYQQVDGVAAVTRNAPLPDSLPNPIVSPSAPLERASTLRLHSTVSGIVPDDPRFGEQWYLRKISATSAWTHTVGSTNVVVAVLDSGVDYNHPDLEANMWRNPGETGLDAQGNDRADNGIDDDDNGYIDDVHGIDSRNGGGDPMDIGLWDPPNPTADDPAFHGTAVAGIIGATGNNSQGIAGVCWTVQIMAIRRLSGDRSDPAWIESLPGDYLRAIDYILMMRKRGVNVRILNISSGGSWSGNIAVNDAFAALEEADILTVCAAGNFAASYDLYPFNPGAIPNLAMITVAATTETDSLADFSNFSTSAVDLAAPGVNITTTWGNGQYTAGFGGTSASAPLVSGAAALLISMQPNLTAQQVKAFLVASVDKITSLRSRVITGGRLNIGRALELLKSQSVPPIVVSALPGGRSEVTNVAIRVSFSRPMNSQSVESSFLISPSIPGAFNWSDDGGSFTFVPTEPYNTATNYQVKILATALDSSGATLDGNFNRVLESSPADDFTWTFRFPISNDAFDSAAVLTGDSGVAPGNNRYALIDLGEPRNYLGDWRNYGNSVWYRWTTAQTGWSTFDLRSGTAFDSQLVVYTGGQVGALSPVAGSDNYGPSQASRVSFHATAGTTYSIVVATKEEQNPNAGGSFRLQWYPTPPPGFTGSQFSPSSGAPGTRVTLTGTNFTGATAVLFNGASASFTNAPANNLDLRITAIVPPNATSGPITVVTPYGNAVSTVSFQILPPPLSLAWTASGELEIRWAAASPALTLEVSEDLRSAWKPVVEPPEMANGQSKLALNPAAANRFYRLRAR